MGKKDTTRWQRYAGLGLQMFCVIAAAVGLGYLLDKSLAWGFPVFLLLFMLLALVGMIYKLYRQMD